MEDQFEKMRQDCWDNALYSTGKSYIYSIRIEKIKWQVSWSKTLGIIIPVALGGLVSSYFQYKDFIKWVLLITSALALLQLIFSTILTVNNVEENLVKFAKQLEKHSLLSDSFVKLASYPPQTFEELQIAFNLLEEREKGITSEDSNFTDKEKRMGMRYGLREFQRQCVCGEIPIDMTPTDCPVCGRF